MKEESGCVVAFIKPRRIGHEGNGLVRPHSEPHISYDITSAVDGVERGPKKYNRFLPKVDWVWT